MRVKVGQVKTPREVIPIVVWTLMDQDIYI
jgi:hypothetical protein